MITASQVKELREITGAGMMDCKKVLTETDGDMEKAMELLRERGIAKAAKKSDRVAAEGLVDCLHFRRRKSWSNSRSKLQKQTSLLKMRNSKHLLWMLQNKLQKKILLT